MDAGVAIAAMRSLRVKCSPWQGQSSLPKKMKANDEDDEKVNIKQYPKACSTKFKPTVKSVLSTQKQIQKVSLAEWP